MNEVGKTSETETEEEKNPGENVRNEEKWDTSENLGVREIERMKSETYCLLTIDKNIIFSAMIRTAKKIATVEIPMKTFLKWNSRDYYREYYWKGYGRALCSKPIMFLHPQELLYEVNTLEDKIVISIWRTENQSHS